MSDTNNTNPDPPGSTGNPNSFMVNPTPPEEGAQAVIEVESAGVSPTKSFVGTGMTELEQTNKKPKLQGEILFVNGYHSSSFGGNYNALLDINPDEPNFFKMRGDNTNEQDRTGPGDVLTDEELDEIEDMSPVEKYFDQKYPTDPTGETKEYVKGMFWGYWNDIQNDHKSTETYAGYFNALNNDHYFNGSHGLESNAAHRIDHGIALGYNWARQHWFLREKEEVENLKEQDPSVESDSPPYRPITIVAHSQGTAVGAGIALGVLHYANELGWEQAALNMIYLGVHQPEGLHGEDYRKFMYAKKDYYGVDANFWEGDPFSFLYGKDRQVYKFMNGISELFSSEEDKLKHRRGTVEHLKAISDWKSFKKRSLQFTFANDRADLVFRDGDMPEMDCACNPEVDTTLFSVEYFTDRSEVPSYYESMQGKEIIDVEEGGSLVVPAYAVIERIHMVEDSDNPGEFEHEFWQGYRSIARDWGNALAKFKRLKRAYQQESGRPFEEGPPSARYPGLDTHGYWRVAAVHRQMLYHYGRLQHADLYAHTCPVKFIDDPELLGSSDSFNDALGTQSIWERIKKAGQDMFYRVEYPENPEGGELTDDQKTEAKNYVDGEGKNQLVSTSIAETDYIKNVIDVFVRGKKTEEKLDKLYTEPGEHYE